MRKKTKPIKVWRFHEAPAKYRSLFSHGGDEHWLAVVPYEHWKVHGIPLWRNDNGGSFGCCDVSKHHLMNGSLVLIGAHA